MIARAVEDLTTIVARDPSVRSRGEALLHPALPALWSHRVAHVLHRRGWRRGARALAGLARAASGGVEIHPGARLGRRVFIDHGAALVIGETAVVGDDVTIFHQVTLGAVGWWRDAERDDGERRHPSIGDRVVLGAGATVLGPVTVGDDALIGASALVQTSVPVSARVLASPAAVLLPHPAPATDGPGRVPGTAPARALRVVAGTGCRPSATPPPPTPRDHRPSA
ncbi:serine O-acetyltransferase EpsC [Geodermatophilus sp. CPCC 205506]|uniref:serine O-acetyltransferase EpsC n=1 Tax=Geodermatophilus sp. CPCC 205506 TaxID=2936596 RepID=UPI003EEF8CD5